MRAEPRRKLGWGWALGGLAGLVVCCVLAAIVYGVNVQQQQAAQATATARAQATATARAQATATARAQATATARAQATATARAQATATAQVLLGLINSWDIVLNDSFTENNNGWYTGNVNTDLWSGNKSISGGKMVWVVEQSKSGFVTWDWPSTVESVADFYLSVEARRISGPISSACYGLWYRGSGSDYYAEACDDQTYRVLLHSEEDGWETLLGFETSNAIKPNQKNKLAILARGSHFDFYINDQLVNTLDNSRWSNGLVGIMIEMNEGDTGSFEFDNFIVRSPY